LIRNQPEDLFIVKKWAALGVVILMAVCSTGRTDARGQAVAPIRAGQNPSWVLPIVKRDSLLNGLQLAVIEREGTGRVSVHLRINNGATFDLANKGGLADLTAGMLLKGGAGLDAKGVADTVESLGITISVQTGWDATDIAVNGPSDALEPIFDLLNRLVTAPAFDQKEFDSLKASRAAILKTEAAKDTEWAKRKALELLFASHPFGRPAWGTEASVSRITRDDLLYYYNRFYTANNAVLLVTGDSTSDKVTRLARSKLGSWKKGEKVPATFRQPEPAASRRVVISERPAMETAYACIAQIGVSRSSPDVYNLLVISEILANQYSQLAASRPKSSVGFDLGLRGLPGPMLVEVVAPSESLVSLIDDSLSAISNIQSGKVTSDQLEAAKAQAIARFAERLGTPEGTAGVLLDIELYGLGRDFLVNFSGKVNGVTVPDVVRAAQAHLKPGTVIISVAGPVAKLESDLKKLGNVAARY
jgi:zinc protease